MCEYTRVHQRYAMADVLPKSEPNNCKQFLFPLLRPLELARWQT